MPADEGWGSPRRARSYHYFRDSMSLCGRWDLTVSFENPDPEYVHLRDDFAVWGTLCTPCEEKRVKKIRAEREELQVLRKMTDEQAKEIKSLEVRLDDADERIRTLCRERERVTVYSGGVAEEPTAKELSALSMEEYAKYRPSLIKTGKVERHKPMWFEASDEAWAVLVPLSYGWDDVPPTTTSRDPMYPVVGAIDALHHEMRKHRRKRDELDRLLRTAVQVFVTVLMTALAVMTTPWL